MKTTSLYGSVFVMAMILMPDPVTASTADLALRYNQPAANWETEALPIGNGRLGAMVFGGVGTERIQFNEDSLWIGDETDTGAYQAFGDLFIDLGDHATSGYRRELNIERAVHTVSYTKDGVVCRREYFASHPAGVLAAEESPGNPVTIGNPAEAAQLPAALRRPSS